MKPPSLPKAHSPSQVASSCLSDTLIFLLAPFLSPAPLPHLLLFVILVPWHRWACPVSSFSCQICSLQPSHFHICTLGLHSRPLSLSSSSAPELRRVCRQAAVVSTSSSSQQYPEQCLSCVHLPLPQSCLTCTVHTAPPRPAPPRPQLLGHPP